MMWVNIKIAGKWMFIPLKMVLIGIDPYPCGFIPSKDEMPSLKKKMVLHRTVHIFGL